jgi:hypothetical protein
MRYEPSAEPHPLRERKKVPKYDMVGQKNKAIHI